jgi:hypothetical protein
MGEGMRMNPGTNIMRGLIEWAGRGSRLVAGLLMGLAWMGSLSAPLYAQEFAHIDQLFFSKGYGGADPLLQVLTVTSNGPAFGFNASASTSTGGDWLTVSPSGDCCMTPAPLSVIGNLLRPDRVHRRRYFAYCQSDSGGCALRWSGVRQDSGSTELLHEARGSAILPGNADR